MHSIAVPTTSCYNAVSWMQQLSKNWLKRHWRRSLTSSWRCWITSPSSWRIGPTARRCAWRAVHSHYQLLGFYHGIPKTGRNSGYNLVAPDRISIYRRPIEAQCRSEEELREMVRRVVLHELAHHFGIDDSRLHEIGAY